MTGKKNHAVWKKNTKHSTDICISYIISMKKGALIASTINS